MAITLKPVEFIPTTVSIASEWILWHKALKKRYGVTTANTLWLKAWGKRGCAGLTCSTNTEELRSYISEQGIQINGGVWDFIPDAWDNLSDTFTQAFNVGSYVVVAVVIILVLFLALLAWNIGKDPNGTINSVAKLKGGLPV